MASNHGLAGQLGAILKIACAFAKRQHILSYGRSSGRGGSFNRSGPSSKKDKKKKQEFHKHKVKFSDEEKLDFASLKERAIVSLDHLGKQHFSEEGYGFENWMTSFNMLLDDFEERAGAENLPKEYVEKRQKLSAGLVRASDSSSLDIEIAKLQAEQRDMMDKLQKMSAQSTHDKESQDRAAKIDTLNEERSKYEALLREEKERLEERKLEIEDSKKFFKRIFRSSSGPSLESIEARISDLRGKLEALDRKLSEHKLKREVSGYRVLTPAEIRVAFPDEQAELDAIDSKLEKLQEKKLAASELSEERENATKTIAEILSKIELGPAESSAQVQP